MRRTRGPSPAVPGGLSKSKPAWPSSLGRSATPKVHDQARLWNDLRQVHDLIASGMPLHPENRLEPGRPVEFQAGPLAGLQGVIVRSHSGSRFFVKVDFIQRGASVLLDESVIAPI